MRRTKLIPLRELAVFCRKASFLLDAGLPVKDAIPILAAQSSWHGAILSDVHKLVMQGESFSEALRLSGAFPAFMCGYIAIGERTARVADVCTKLGDFYENKSRAEDELAAAMLYPAVVAAMMFGVIILAVTFVLPGYSRIFEASDIALPAVTNALLSVSDFFAANALIVFGGFFIFLTCVMLFFRSVAGRVFLSSVKIKIPILRQKINLNITEGLSLLLSSGINISEALNTCGEILDNHVAKNDLQKISARVNSGVSFWEAIGDVSYINPLLPELARVGEETGHLPQTLEKCSAYFAASYQHEVRRLNKLIEPVITLTLGVILGAIMLAIILPTFELATAI